MLVSTIGCQEPAIKSTAKPKAAPGINVELPDINVYKPITGAKTVRVPVLKPFTVTMKVHGIDANAQKKELITLSFLPLKDSADAAKNWSYGMATMASPTRPDDAATTWECTGTCLGVAKPGRMRAYITLGTDAEVIAEFDVEGVENWATAE